MKVVIIYLVVLMCLACVVSYTPTPALDLSEYKLITKRLIMKEMVKCPTRDFGYGITSHRKHHTELRPMEELEHLIRNRI